MAQSRWILPITIRYPEKLFEGRAARRGTTYEYFGAGHSKALERGYSRSLERFFPGMESRSGSFIGRRSAQDEIGEPAADVFDMGCDVVCGCTKQSCDPETGAHLESIGPAPR